MEKSIWLPGSDGNISKNVNLKKKKQSAEDAPIGVNKRIKLLYCIEKF